MELSPQKKIIVEKLRCKDWVCSSVFGYIKDDRKRISELNEGYMREKGYEIIGKPCDGRCGKNHSSGLYMRKAVKVLGSPQDKYRATFAVKELPKEAGAVSLVEAQDSWFESL